MSVALLNEEYQMVCEYYTNYSRTFHYSDGKQIDYIAMLHP